MQFDTPSLQGVTHDESTHNAIFLDDQVLQELVGRFAGLPSAAHVVADMKGASVSSCGSDLRRSTSSFSSSASEGSIPAMNVQERVSKRWEEPLLTLQQKVEIELETQKESKRLAKEEKIESARRQREVEELANCVHDVSPSGRTFKRNKLRKVLNKSGISIVCRFLRNSLSVFKSHKDHEGYPTAREFLKPVVIPQGPKSAFFPSETAAANAAPAQMRGAPQKARSYFQFQAVKSTQRDVEAWTMEEYMTRNARLHKRNRRKDEEFGGIEGNNLMNQYFDDDVTATYDSDSD